MNCLDCAKCVPAKKWIYKRDGRNFGLRQLYVCKSKRRYISKKYFDKFPQRDYCFEKKEN